MYIVRALANLRNFDASPYVDVLDIWKGIKPYIEYKSVKYYFHVFNISWLLDTFNEWK